MEYSSNAKGNLGVTLGAIGTGLGVIGNHGGFNLFGGNNAYVSKDELNYVQELARKDSEIALLKSEQNTEIKIADVYERLITRINADAKAQADVNSAQAVYNATANSAINLLQNQVCVLNGLTKTVVPITNVCPEPMPAKNSWTAPTT